MRLLHSATLEFEVFHDEQIPRYAILSHTWGEEEVSYQEMRFLQQYRALPTELKENETFVAAIKVSAGLNALSDNKTIQTRAGYRKIQETADIARERELEYFWIDTCCIDKSSSAELQEAINSMYRWYQQSSFCAVHLEDIDLTRSWHPPNVDDFGAMLRSCKWITRGWTLQELIAPRTLVFFDQSFTYINTLGTYTVITLVARATGVSEYVLRTGDLSQSSVAQKMSWAAARKTTRIEDRAYSMMGLFGIQMPMLYGEGENAFSRLQEEIIRTIPDDSIFAWRASEGSLSSYCGLLAKSPDAFQRSQHVVQGRGKFAMSNLGLKIEALVSMEGSGYENNCACHVPSDAGRDSVRLLSLNATQGGRVVGLLVRRLESSFYARLAPNTFKCTYGVAMTHETLYSEHPPRIPAQLTSCAMQCFHFELDLFKYHILSVQPRERWCQSRKELLIGTNDLINDDNPHILENEFCAMVWLRCNRPGTARPFSIFCTFNMVTGHVLAKLLSFDHTSHEANWYSAIRDIENSTRLKEFQTRDEMQLPWGVQVGLDIRPALHRGLISHIVHIS